MNQEITIKIPLVGQTIAGNNGTSSIASTNAPPPDLTGQMTMSSMTSAETDNTVASPPDIAAFVSDTNTTVAIAPGPETQLPMNMAIPTGGIAPGPEEVMTETSTSGRAPEPSASDLSDTAGSMFSQVTAPPPDLNDMQDVDVVPMPDMETTSASQSSEKKLTTQTRTKK